MDRDFVERRDDGLYLVGSRVPLDCVVREFREGRFPETIRSDFPTLSLEQVYGAITFYLGHKDQVDNDIAARERLEDAFSEEHPAPPVVSSSDRSNGRTLGAFKNSEFLGMWRDRSDIIDSVQLARELRFEGWKR